MNLVEVREVEIKRIHPNPWRDGTGAATWESVEKVYGYDEAKLRELVQSIETNGLWAGIHVRQRRDGEYELCFGHHRVEAAKRAGLKKLTVILGGYSDDAMLQMMANENTEEYGHDFALGVMNSVEAVIKAYGEGKVKLEPVAPEAKGRSSVINDKLYSPLTIGKYLGWMTNGKPADKVFTAITATQLVQQGALKRTQLKGLGHFQARELVTMIKRKMEQEKAAIETQTEVLRQRAAAAQKDGDKNRLRKLEQQLDDLSSNAPKHVTAAAQQVASAVKQHFDQGASIRSALDEVAKEAGVEPAKPKGKAPKQIDYGVVDQLGEKLDRLAIFDDPTWRKILSIAGESRTKKPFERLSTSMERLGQRLQERRKELGRKLS